MALLDWTVISIVKVNLTTTTIEPSTSKKHIFFNRLEPFFFLNQTLYYWKKAYQTKSSTINSNSWYYKKNGNTRVEQTKYPWKEEQENV